MYFFEAIKDYYYKPILFAFVLGLLLIFLALKIFPKLKLVDRPYKYGLNRAPIPYYGGIAIYLAFSISILVFLPISRLLIGLLTSSTIIVLLGFFDDLLNIKPWIRLIFQLIASSILVYCGVGILSLNIPFFGTLDFTIISVKGFFILSAIFTVIWVITVLNVMNFVDGIGGISSGVSFIAGISLFALSIHPLVHENPASQVPIATIACILAMIAFVFLIFDFPESKILMGDTGSTFLGFVIATLAIFSGGKVATLFLVLGIPILDMVWVVLRRIFSGRKFWKGDLKHLHHRLLDAGFSKRQVVLLYLFITIIFGISSVTFVSTNQKFFILIALIFLMILLGISLVFLLKKKE